MTLEGFGLSTNGGQGGEEILVTNLLDEGPDNIIEGSLRWALGINRKRTIKFKVAGDFELKETIKKIPSEVSLLGQTAPKGGVCIRSHPANSKSPIRFLNMQHFIIQHMRFRPGVPNVIVSNAQDGLQFMNCQHGVVDHSSISWGDDENLDFFNCQNVTVSWCILSEGTRDKTHWKSGRYGAGCLISKGSKNVSVHHNLFAHNGGRNPRMNMEGVVDIRNNIIYNSGDHPSSIDNTHNPLPTANYVGNLLINGRNSTRDYLIVTKSNRASLYLLDNITPTRSESNPSQIKGVVRDSDIEFIDLRSIPFPVAEVETYPASSLLDTILPFVGAIYPRQDSVDERIIRDVLEGTGLQISHQDEVGGWPDLTTGPGDPDTEPDDGTVRITTTGKILILRDDGFAMAMPGGATSHVKIERGEDGSN